MFWSFIHKTIKFQEIDKSDLFDIQIRLLDYFKSNFPREIQIYICMKE